MNMAQKKNAQTSANPLFQLASAPSSAGEKAQAAAWFRQLQNDICAALEKIEDEYSGVKGARFAPKKWRRETPDKSDGGGGEMRLLKGDVFEKAGVNFSEVYGQFSPEMRASIPGAGEGGGFWASGISLVIHPKNPHVPPVHMNTRHICTTNRWFGGGADLNPIFAIDADTKDFHAALQRACDGHNPAYYPAYRDWCDDYFTLAHRGEKRGVGGVFYDYHDSGSWAHDFAFTQSIGKAFLEIYPQLVRRHMFEAYDETERAAQLKKRGRYVEFNLLYDRGTRFGLMTGGNVEAILMSLPPLASWE